jgi:Na+/H+ antiporter NhaD/arsenite permease-like protein
MSDVQIWAAVLIFAVTYAVIAFSKIPHLHLDRPGAALCGAALMVACGVLSFDEAWAAIDGPTIVLLLGMMILNVLLEDSGFFALAAATVMRRAGSPVRLLVGLVILSAVLSALFLNDTVCLMLTVPTIEILRKRQLPLAPYLIALAMSANIGSVMTEVGNPQNMLIAGYSGWSYIAFLAWMAPVGVVGLAVLVAILLLFYGRTLRAYEPTAIDHQSESRPAVDRRLLVESLVVLGAVLVSFMTIGHLPEVAIAGAAILLVVSRRPAAEVLARVNWVLLAFFAGLFIVVRGLENTGLAAELTEVVRPLHGENLATQVPVFSTLTVLLSNLVSNVPFVVLAKGVVPTLIEPDWMWLVLAMASTFGGNLTIPGSVATLIVLETAQRRLPTKETAVGFFQFFAVGLPVTIATTTLGALVLAAERWLVDMWR